jgi:hypothetical protein
MNEAEKAVINYLTNTIRIQDVSHEGIEQAIDIIFNYKQLLPLERQLFNIIINQAIDCEKISEILTSYLMEEELKKIEAQREDYDY